MVDENSEDTHANIAVSQWHKYDGENSEELKRKLDGLYTCSICLSELNDSRVCLLPCGHCDFCESCALHWLTRVFCNCPICKTDVTAVIRIGSISDKESDESQHTEHDDGEDDANGDANPTQELRLEAFKCDKEVIENARRERVLAQSEGAPDLSCLDAGFFLAELNKLHSVAEVVTNELKGELAPPRAVRRAEEIKSTALFLCTFIDHSKNTEGLILEYGTTIARTIACMAEEIDNLRRTRGCGASSRMQQLQDRERMLDEQALASMEPEDSQFCYKVTHPPPQSTLLDAFVVSPTKKQKQKRKKKQRKKATDWPEEHDLDDIDDASFDC